MFCSECGKEINNEVKFCPFCGFKVLEQKKSSETKGTTEIKKSNNVIPPIVPLGNFKTSEIQEVFVPAKNSELNKQSNNNFDEFLYNVSRKNFNKLNDQDKRKLILLEIEREDEERAFRPGGLTIYIPFAGTRYKYLREVLYKFDNGLFKDENLYNILIERKFLLDKDEPVNSPTRRYLRQIRDQLIVSVALDFFALRYIYDLFPILNNYNFFISFIFIALISWIILEILFLPWNIAWANKHQSAWGILIVNLLLFWTIIGWILSLIWSLNDIKQR